MFVKLFKSNHQILIAVLFIIGAILWLFSFFNPQTPVEPRVTELLYNFIYPYLLKLPPFIITLIAFGLLFLQSVILNNLVINHNLNDKNTFLPALCYFIFMSLIPGCCTLNNVLIVNLVLLLCLNSFFKIYLKEDTFAPVFNISFFLALLSLIYLPAALYLLLLWSVFLIYRNNAWREWIISFIGFALPYIFVSFFFFWNDQLEFLSNFYTLFSLKGIHPDFQNISVLSSIVILAFIFFVMLRYYNNYKDKIVMLRKYASIIITLFFISILPVYLSDSDRTVFLSLTYISAAIFTGQFFLKVRKEWISELIFIIFIIIFILNRINLKIL